VCRSCVVVWVVDTCVLAGWTKRRVGTARPPYTKRATTRTWSWPGCSWRGAPTSMLLGTYVGSVAGAGAVRLVACGTLTPPTALLRPAGLRAGSHVPALRLVPRLDADREAAGG